MTGRSRSAIEDFELKWSAELESADDDNDDHSSLVIVYSEELMTLTDLCCHQQQLTDVRD